MDTKRKFVKIKTNNNGVEIVVHTEEQDIQNDLDYLEMELDSNLLNQEELRSAERGLREEIELLEVQLENLDDDDNYENCGC